MAPKVNDANDSSELSELDSSQLSGSDSSELSELDSDDVSTPERFRSESPALRTTSASSSGVATRSSSSSSGFVAKSSSSSSSSGFAAKSSSSSSSSGSVAKSSPAQTELTPLQRLARRRFHPRDDEIAHLDVQRLSPAMKRQRSSRFARIQEAEGDDEEERESGVPARYRLSKEPTELENTAPSQGMQPDDEPVHRDRFPGRSAPRANVPVRAPGKLAWPGFATTERVTFLSYPPADAAAQRRIEKRLQDARKELEKSGATPESSSTVSYPTSDLRTRIDNTQPSSGRAPYSGTSDRERGWCAVAASLGQTVAETKAKVADWERRNNAAKI